MRVPSYLRTDARRERPAMTSMIDVVFLLLIFFICASVGLTHEDLLSTVLSHGDEASATIEELDQSLGEVWIKLRQSPADDVVMELEGREIQDLETLNATLTQLAEVAPEIPVILDIAEDVRMEDVIDVYDICVLADFESVNFATRTAPSEKKE